MKPIIVVTANYSYDDSIGINAHMGGILQQWNLIAQDYISAIEAAGGIPIILPIYNNPDVATELLGKVDGVLFTGGDDIYPMHYGEDVISDVGTVNDIRDRQELSLMKYVLENTQLPILGICRGCQLINVACGGNLYQDMASAGLRNHMLPSLPMHLASHSVDIDEKSKFFDILKSKRINVNSYHHQCIKNVGKGIQIVAKDKDDIVEAIEIKERSSMTIGVQWHPEGMQSSDNIQRAIFEKFISCAKGDYKW